MATRASNSSPYFLRVAEASAASSASKMISLSTPFSFETASTTIRISLFTTFTSTAGSSGLRGKLCLADFAKQHADRLVIDFQRDTFILDCSQPSRVTAATALARHLQLNPHARSDEALKMRARAQHSVEARRGHLEPIGRRNRVL